jgi:hypothetical protein
VEKSFPSKQTPQIAGVAILISDKVDFRLKSISRGNEDHFILILPLIDRSSRQKINKETSELDQIAMVDIYRVFHPTTRQYIFFSAAHGIFSKIGHVLGHKASLNKFKKIKITLCILSDHSRIKLDLNDKRNPENIQTRGDLKTHW